MYDLIIIDEISMVSTADYNDIKSIAMIHGKKILMVGDFVQNSQPRTRIC